MVDSPERDTDEIIENVEVPLYHGLNIHQRLNGARGDTETIEKTPRGTGGMKYDFIAHDDVTAHVKPILQNWGINPWHTIIDHKQDGNRTEILLESTFYCIDKPDDALVMRTLGYGVDTQDKGPGKAETYAVKIAFLKALLLNSAEDVEGADIEHDPEVARHSQIAEAENVATKAQIAWANTYKRALNKADSIEVLDDIIKESKGTLKDMPDITRTYLKEVADGIRKEMLEG